MLSIIDIEGHSQHLSALKNLLIDYSNYMYNELGLIAGKNTFYKDIENLPGSYKYPDGTFFLASYEKELVGTVAIKRFDECQCEIKRMYVIPDARGKGIGKQLCLQAIKTATDWGFQKMLLDTNQEMKEAVKLYLSIGFNQIPAYCINENDHPIYMEYELSKKVLT